MSDRLLDRYDAVLLDLDGTVYRGAEAVPGAAGVVARIRDAGVAVRFVTNNASRSPEQVADHLRELGVPADLSEVCTSAQAAAAVLAERLPAEATVLVVGTNALSDEVRNVGLRPTAQASGDVVAVVQGLSQNVGWRELSEACLAIRAGALWVACNVDPTLPTERGQLIGNGALVAAVATATGTDPVVAGKPSRPLLDQAAGDAHRPLVVGDRLDTDIAGAVAAGLDSLLVLSGVTTPADVLAARPELRPTYLAADLTALSGRTSELAIAEQPGWTIDPDGRVRRTATATSGDAFGLLRALCAAQVPDGEPGRLHAGDDAAKAALAELGLEIG
ncbi:MAG TPA: HAD-IIA family hydrolase [Actinophytocola sp.]|uniref:HAD-IIA family hydrolase n=1 Tax=Actinophytocola sp. TaxID=1872138 RepID=UPI002DB6AF01|nr:HAD-IIA family hydrolase [Actinophytocola sp.]HEU5476035.1 HAD-IIA family hydrolase [Actinophytocola sp.]